MRDSAVLLCRWPVQTCARCNWRAHSTCVKQVHTAHTTYRTACTSQYAHSLPAAPCRTHMHKLTNMRLAGSSTQVVIQRTQLNLVLTHSLSLSHSTHSFNHSLIRSFDHSIIYPLAAPGVKQSTQWVGRSFRHTAPVTARWPLKHRCRWVPHSY